MMEDNTFERITIVLFCWIAVILFGVVNLMVGVAVICMAVLAVMIFLIVSGKFNKRLDEKLRKVNSMERIGDEPTTN